MSHFYPQIFNIPEQQGVLWLACELAVDCGFGKNKKMIKLAYLLLAAKHETIKE